MTTWSHGYSLWHCIYGPTWNQFQFLLGALSTCHFLSRNQFHYSSLHFECRINNFFTAFFGNFYNFFLALLAWVLGWVGHHRQRGKTATGSALDGAVLDSTQILAYLVNNMSRSQLCLGFGHFGCMTLFFFRSITFWWVYGLNCISSVEITLFLLSDILVKTVCAKPYIFGTKNIWVWGNVLDDLSMTLTQGHGCDIN